MSSPSLRRRACPSSSTPVSRSGTCPPCRARPRWPARAASGCTARAGAASPGWGGRAVRGRQWRAPLAGPPTLHSHVGQGGDVRADPAVSVLEAREAPVAARVGLAAAVAELVSAGPDAVAVRLAALGVRLRRLLLDRV